MRFVTLLPLEFWGAACLLGVGYMVGEVPGVVVVTFMLTLAGSWR